MSKNLRQRKMARRIGRKTRKAHLDKRARFIQEGKEKEALRELALANMYIDKLDPKTNEVEVDDDMRKELMFWQQIKNI